MPTMSNAILPRCLVQAGSPCRARSGAATGRIIWDRHTTRATFADGRNADTAHGVFVFRHGLIEAARVIHFDLPDHEQMPLI